MSAIEIKADEFACHTSGQQTIQIQQAKSHLTSSIFIGFEIEAMENPCHRQLTLKFFKHRDVGSSLILLKMHAPTSVMMAISTSLLLMTGQPVLSVDYRNGTEKQALSLNLKDFHLIRYTVQKVKPS